MKGRFTLAACFLLSLAGCKPSAPATRHPQETAHAYQKISPSLPPEAGQSFHPETHDLIPPGDVPLLEQINRENSRVVHAALPSVVRIKASWPAEPRARLFGGKIPFNLPFAPKSHSEMQADDTAFSSGVILSRDGYILTNEHAVTDFTRFEVQLNDKRIFRARVVAADELVDVAILKIDATDLVPLPWGDSDKVQVGEQVFAIGDPFDLADSVSKGIVSAKGRNIPESEEDMPHYEDFIQTDAAINPGNSGGALINIHGELIGLNAAIASTTRLSMGIGFAIPSNLVRYAVEGLFKDGHLTRGYLGVVLPDSVDDGVVDQLGLTSSEGALLADVQPGEPADKAKLRPFDFITSVDKHRIDSEAGLRLVVAQLPIGKQVEVDFVRGGKPLSTTVQIAEPPQLADDGASAPVFSDDDDQAPAHPLPPGANVLTGLQVLDLNDRNRDKFRIGSAVTNGVVVGDVKAGSAADEKGIEKGDVLESFSVNHTTSAPLASVHDFQSLSSSLKPDQGVVLLVYDNRRRNSFIYLEPPLK
jgi:serine protease Do